MLITLILATTTVVTADDSPQAPPPLSGHSYQFFYAVAGTSAGANEVHRGILVFGRSGVTCEIFPGGMSIPYTATFKTQRARRGAAILSDFSANGQAIRDGRIITFTASKDGDGAKGSVSVSQSGRTPITIPFQGTRPAK